MYRTRLSTAPSVLRLSIDPISNAIAISAANPVYPPEQPDATLRSPDTWGAALSEGVLADELLWPIIHELTHHSCLNSAVGASMATLAVSHTSMGSSTIDEEKFSWIARDAVRHTLMEKLLRPLLEGLALFVEHDAISGAVPIASWSQQIANDLFCGGDMFAALLRGDDVLAPLKQKLETLRQNQNRISEKKRLLRRSLEDNDGYLLGYMLVKMIWNDLVARAPIWNHSDVFQAFLTDYFFNDYYLAKMLVPLPSEEREELVVEIEVITNYLHNRLILLSKSFTAFAQEFVPWLHDNSNPRPSYQSFSSTEQKELLLRWTIRTSRSLHWHTPDFLTTRGIARVLVAPAKVKVDKEGRFEAVFDKGFPSILGPAMNAGRPSDGSEAIGDGSVEAVILLPNNHRRSIRLLLCVLLDKDLIATFNPLTGKFNDLDANDPCDNLASYLAIESFCVMVEQELVFPEGSETQSRIEALKGSEGRKRMLDLWAPFALCPDIDESDRPESYRLFQQAGLKGALSLTDSQMSLLSRVSLLPIDSRTPSSSTLSAQEIQMIDEINAKSIQILGFRLLNLEGQTLRPSRI